MSRWISLLNSGWQTAQQDFKGICECAAANRRTKTAGSSFNSQRWLQKKMNLLSVPYFTLPQSLVRTHVLRAMKSCELALYVLLCHQMERFSKSQFTMKNADISDLTGLSASSLRHARTKLVERCLVQCQRGLGGIYTYTMLDPNTGEAWPKRLNRTRPVAVATATHSTSAIEHRRREPEGVSLKFP
jgi:hypothetical protein